MKKTLIILFLIFLISCQSIKVFEVHQRFYPKSMKSESITDIYSQLNIFDTDSVPLKEWNSLQLYNNKGYIIEKMLRNVVDKKTEYAFFYKTFTEKDTVFYEVNVRCTSKDKKIIDKFLKKCP